jgi:crotonobetainyl-CoA:carnitine CoA-transferase CaiB-like acyl-CoA transferase
VTPSEGAGPLAGLKVVKLARILAGPWIGQTLADLGADVIKVESPEGDETRTVWWESRPPLQIAPGRASVNMSTWRCSMSWWVCWRTRH